MNLLVSLFIKNSEDVKDPDVRSKYGVLTGLTGIICNILLFALKIFIGLATGAFSIAADALNNLSDAASSVVTFLSFKTSAKPADKEHPLGHGRMEYVSGIIVSIAIVVVGVELLQTSVQKILHPEELTWSVLTVVILLFSICLKLWMAYLYTAVGKRIGSVSLKASAVDSLSDCITTSVVLICVLIFRFLGVNVDGYASLVVSVFVLAGGIGQVKDTMQPLLGMAPSEEEISLINKIVLEDNRILGLHDLIIHDYGPGRLYATVHAEVDSKLTLLEAHDIIDRAERRVHKKSGFDLVIHGDPVVIGDAQTDTYKRQVESALIAIHPEIHLHDFRVVQGKKRAEIYFDAVVPYSLNKTEEEIRKEIIEDVRRRIPNSFLHLQIDRFSVR